MPNKAGTRGEGQGSRQESEPGARPEPPLSGIGVLVTRPAPQAASLVRHIEAAGGRPVLWPALEILPPRDCVAPRDLAARLERAHVALFISPNAVTHALAILPAPAWPPRLTLAAVGDATARAVRTHLGRGPDLVPAERYDSEGLLALPELQRVNGKQILILRGEGGRELLADTLRARGATVEYAEVYRRACPACAPAEACAALAEGRVAVVTATSSEVLHHLVQMAGDQAEALRGLPLIVVSGRMRETAEKLGFRGPVQVARGAGDEALMDALLAWKSGSD